MYLIDTFIPNFHKYHDAFVAAVNRNVKFIFFVINPRCAPAQWRQKEIIDPKLFTRASFPAGILDYWNAIRSIAQATVDHFPDSVEARFYSHSPGFPIYLVED